MCIPAEMAERHGLVFAELAAIGLESARDLRDRQLAAEDADVATRAALALHRVMRSIRQTLALEQRQERERQQASRDTAAQARRDNDVRVQARKARVKAVVERLIWDEHEYESDETGNLEVELADRLDREAVADDFADQPIEACVARLCAALGIPAQREDEATEHTKPPAAGAEANRAPSVGSAVQDPDDEDDYWRSSA